MSAVAMHPEATDDPSVVRWVIPAGVLALVGVPSGLPQPLAALVNDGTVVAVRVEPGVVSIELGPGLTWRSEGARVRTALAAALQDPAAWIPADATAGSADSRLRAAVDAVIAGDVGDYIRSHGGRVVLVDAQDHRARVALDGECDGCPARGFTLALRFERAVRALYPNLLGIDLARN